MAPEQARDTRQATMASDVFALGATMLFAATGHPPYQGETVMDVLVRLATEPPDLSGLPGELADIVSACLERDPRRRPTSAAVLARLAPGVIRADAAGRGPSALPDSALALIAGYRRDPQPAALATDESGDEDTFGSHPALGTPHRAVAGGRLRRWLRSRGSGPDGSGGPDGSRGPGRSGGPDGSGDPRRCRRPGRPGGPDG